MNNRENWVQSFLKNVLSALQLGFIPNRLLRFRDRFVLDGRTKSLEARVAFDYMVFRRQNSLFNQLILNFTLLLTVSLIPIIPLIVVWCLFQINEMLCIWMTGKAEIEIQNNNFNVSFWNKFKYINNFIQFFITGFAFAIFTIYVSPSSLLPTGTSYLIVVILSSSLNFFSAKFNLFNLIWQLIAFVIYAGFTIYFRGLPFDAPNDLFQLVPVVLTLFAGHAGVWAYHQYYMNSLEKERENFLVQEKLLDFTKIISREKHLTDRIQSTITEAIIVVDYKMDIVQANPAFYMMYTTKNEGDMLLNLGQLIDGSLLKTDGTKRSFQPDPNRHFIIEGTPLFIEGEAGLSLFIVIDVTEKILSDQLATQSQKLNALGVLTGGIAHDFNNILAVIKSNADLISLSDDIDKIKNDYLSDILVSCNNASGLTRQILSFVRNTPLKATLVSPIDILNDTAKMVHNSIEPTHYISIENTASHFVICDPNLFKNAIINLILNARDALPRGGEIKVKVFEDAGNVIFSVEDQGEGIAPEILSKVTEPFFTLKSNEKGTGIGLSMVKQFAERSSGRFQIFSELKKGTRAQIILPAQISDAGLEKNKQKISDSKNQKSTKSFHILVVDDNAMLAKSISRQVEIMKNTAQVAHDLNEVIALTSSQDFDLVICDIVLKSETGLDVWDYFQVKNYKSKFLYISGNISPELREELANRGTYRLIEKPIDYLELKGEIETMMAKAKF